MKITIKKIIYSVFTLFFLLAVIACNSSKTTDKQENVKQVEIEKEHEELKEEATHYQCPMKCEGEKTYTEEGNCPLCKMDLKEVEKV